MLKLEQQNTFNWLIVSFFTGVIITNYAFMAYFNYLPYVEIIISLLLVISSIFIIISKKLVIKYTLSFISFFMLGSVILLFNITSNNTILLEQDLKFVNLIGTVEKVTKTPNSRYSSIFLKDVKILNYQLNKSPNTVKLFTFRKVFLNKNDVIKVYANLESPYSSLVPKGFNYKKDSFLKHLGATGSVMGRIHLLSKFTNIKSESTDVFTKIRNYYINKIQANMENRTSGIAAAVTLGGYSYITKADMQNLTDAGLIPIISISGYHIGIITAFIFIIIRLLLALIPSIALRFDTKKIAASITIILLLFYMALLGNIPPALRSAIMAIFIMGGIIAGIPTISIRSLLLAGLVLLIINPLYVNSASFWLSFLATASMIVFLNSKLAKKLYRLSKKGFKQKILCISILAVLVSLVVESTLFPLIIYYFNSFPMYSIISNLLVTPIFSFIIMPFLFLGMFSFGFVSILAFKISNFGINIMLYIAKVVAALKGSLIYFLPFSEIYIVIITLLFLVVMASNSKIKYVAILLVIFMYIIITNNSYPKIMLDEKFNLVGFLQSNQHYVFNNNRSKKFIQQKWITNSKLIEHINIKESKSIFCDKKYNCLYTINNKRIIYLNNNLDSGEACTMGDLIIIKGFSPFKCQSSFVIDKIFLQKYGSTFIYINKFDTIKIITNQKTFYVKT